MSYCRWSSMNWRCDVYTYEDVAGGWTTHVARSRRILPPIPDILGCDLSMVLHRWSGCTFDKARRGMVYPHRWRGLIYRAWCRLSLLWHYHVHLASLDLIPMRAIGLPFDGKTFNDPTPGECEARLEWLRGLGYVVPQSAINALRAEESDGAVVGAEA